MIATKGRLLPDLSVDILTMNAPPPSTNNYTEKIMFSDHTPTQDEPHKVWCLVVLVVLRTARKCT